MVRQSRLQGSCLSITAYSAAMNFDPKPGDKVLAPHEKDAVSGNLYPVEVVQVWTEGHLWRKVKVAEVTDGNTLCPVDASCLQPVESSG